MNKIEYKFNEPEHNLNQLHQALKNAIKLATRVRVKSKIKKKSWLNDSLDELKREITYWYVRHKKSEWSCVESRIKCNEEKREFRRLQRITIKTLNEQDLIYLNKLIVKLY